MNDVKDWCLDWKVLQVIKKIDGKNKGALEGTCVRDAGIDVAGFISCMRLSVIKAVHERKLHNEDICFKKHEYTLFSSKPFYNQACS